MSDDRPTHVAGLIAEPDQPLIGLILEENGCEVVRYFADEAQADAALADGDTRAALDAIGTFSDLDWEELRDGLEQIRHQSPPTPPIEL